MCVCVCGQGDSQLHVVCVHVCVLASGPAAVCHNSRAIVELVCVCVHVCSPTELVFVCVCCSTVRLQFVHDLYLNINTADSGRSVSSPVQQYQLCPVCVCVCVCVCVWVWVCHYVIIRGDRKSVV